jgi:uncharacterized protein (TIGR03437 family)
MFGAKQSQSENMARLLTRSSILITAGICGISSLWAQAPTGLKVVSATSKQTQLSWSGSASSYTVQRAAVGGSFSTIATVTTASYTDTTIDPYLSFTYQVLAGSPLAASNAVTVGPPPAGLSLAAQAPLVGAEPSQSYGENISLAFDGNGDPAAAFLWDDPKNNGDATAGQLLFRNWNRATNSWNPVVTVGTVGSIALNFRAVLSLAYDTSTKSWAIATETNAGNLRVYSSADGAAWALAKSYATDNGSWIGPSLALAGGKLYLAVDQDSGSLQYITGTLSAPSGWTVTPAPSVKNVGPAIFKAMTSLALDSAGNPGIAYWCTDPNDGYNLKLLHWRPGSSAAPVIVMDSQGQQSDEVAVVLKYFQTNPRIVVYVQRKDADFGVGVHFVRSDDGGATWKTPIVIPPDGASSTDYPFDLALNSKGAGLVAFGQNSGNGSAQCGAPELSRSNDLTSWTTCSPVSSFGDYGSYPSAIQAAFQGNDKLYLTWWNASETQANTGVVLYREKPDNQPTGPVISAVQDAESAQKTVVPGQWVAIYGDNLAGDSRVWNADEFPASPGLPTKVAGVSVSFNGLPAAVYYVSPKQIDAQVPSGVSGTAQVTVSNNGSVSGSFSTTIVANSPTLYVYPAGSKLYAAATHADGKLIGDPVAVGNAGTKALPNENIVLYVNGLASSPAGVLTGGIAYTNPVTVSFTPAGGTATMFTADYAGVSFAGGFQVNLKIPSGLKAGDYDVIVTTQGVSSPKGVTLTVGP